MAKIITVTTSQAETAVDFGAYYQFAWVKNLSDDTDCYISDHSGASAEDDDVALVSAGSSAMIVTSGDTIYIIGSGVKCECRAQNFAECPFGDLAGESGGESITIDPTPTQGSSNAVSSGGVYDALANVGGFTRTVLYDSGSYSQTAPVSQDVNLLDNLSKYDIVSIIVGTLPDNQSVPGTASQSGYNCASAMFDVPYLLTSGCYAHIDSYGVRNMVVQFTDTTFNLKANYGESSNQYLQIFKIIGYKWG